MSEAAVVERKAKAPGDWGATLGSLAHGVTVAALAGAIAGAVAGGVGGRIAMRITAIMATDAEQGALTDAEEVVGDITLDGTMALIIFGGVLSGLLGGLIYASARRWLADAGPWRGPAFGGFLLAVFGWAVIEGDNFDFATLGSVTVNLLMFAAIFLLFGVLIAPLHTWLSRALPTPSLSVRGLLVAPLYAIGLLFSVMIVAASANGFGEGGSEAVFIAVMAVYLYGLLALAAFLIARGGRRFERFSDLRGNARVRVAALALLVPPLVLGSILDIQALTDIIGDAY